MRKLYCLVEIDDGFLVVSDLSNLIESIKSPVNTATPKLKTILFDKGISIVIPSFEYPFEDEISIGQLFYYKKEFAPGSVRIVVDPMDLSDYKPLISKLESCISNYSNKYLAHIKEDLNRTLDVVHSYYNDVVTVELRDKFIDDILE